MRVHGIASALLLLASSLALAGCSKSSERAPAPPVVTAEVRQPLYLEPETRHRVLAEMRSMLVSVDGIVQGIADGDRDAIERSARSAGMRRSVDDDPVFGRGLPAAFRDLGIRTHRTFDQLADAVKDGNPTDEAMRRLREITGQCVGCHAVYRVVEAPTPSGKFTSGAGM